MIWATAAINSFVKKPWLPVIFISCIIPCGDFLLKQAYKPKTFSYAIKYE